MTTFAQLTVPTSGDDSVHVPDVDWNSDRRALAPVGASILVIEDDSETRSGLRELLEEARYEVLEAEDGQKALELLVSEGVPVPGLIVLDLGLPILSGRDLLTILKSYYRLSAIPVLVISGGELPRDMHEAGGAIVYLRKPFDEGRFLRLVQEHASTAS